MTERGLTFQIQTSTGEVVITNDGATILKHMAVLHPAARMVSGCLRTISKLINSLSNCQLLKISKLEMEQPRSSSWLVLSLELLKRF